ncbi:hypothetical protein E1301_Tti022207 [Triplophysa tibetana]|uniref:Uncharacterized protein n=1 Tax=Triplophysa tibetana TaxID=1572043 RepID=A0A5A9PRB3_9TELE|nr:hypothetical protein E1301_Tti022207 [Triplophysa tibetana]
MALVAHLTGANALSDYHQAVSNLARTFKASILEPNIGKTKELCCGSRGTLTTTQTQLFQPISIYGQPVEQISHWILISPIKVRTVMFSRSAPWFTSDLRKMKAAGRALERQYKASGLTVYKPAYRDHQKAYSKSIKEARSQYYSNIIQNSPGNSKKLFSTINHLLKPQVAPLTGATEEQCNNFMTFFRTKIAKIRSSFSVPSSSSVPTADLQSENFKKTQIFEAQLAHPSGHVVLPLQIYGTIRNFIILLVASSSEEPPISATMATLRVYSNRAQYI